MKNWIPFLLITIAVAGTVGYIMYNKPHESAGDSTPEYSVSPTQIVREYLDSEADGNEKYLGKLVQIKGNIRTISLNPNSATITLETGDPMTSVLCEFETPAGLETLSAGKNVSLQGFCAGMLGGDMMSDIILNRCVISP